MMQKYLVLIKHSLPKVEKDISATQWKLSEEGQIRVPRLADSIKRFQPEVIVSSSETKAKETAGMMASILQLELHVVEGLQEHDRSKLPYLAQDVFYASIHEFFQKPDQLVFGSETANQAHARFQRTVQSVLNDHPDKTVVVVTHGTVMSLFVSRLTGISDQSLWNKLGLPSFIVVDLESNALIAQEYNV